MFGLSREVISMSIRQMLALVCCHKLQGMATLGDRQDPALHRMLGEEPFCGALPGGEPCLRCQKLSSRRGMQEALLPGQALHRRISSLDNSAAAGGDPAGALPHAALRRCLDAWVPLLIDECDFAAAFLLLYKPIDEAQAPAQERFGSHEGALPCPALPTVALSVSVSGLSISPGAAAHAELPCRRRCSSALLSCA